MKRAEFLKKLGIGVIAVIITPKVLAEIKPTDQEKSKEWCIKWAEQIYQDSLRKYPMTYAECYKMPNDFNAEVRKYQRYYDEAWEKLYKALAESEKNKFHIRIV